MSWTEETLKAFEQVTAQGSTTHSVWVRPFETVKKDNSIHQFLFFLKPEATATYDGANTKAILQVVEETFSKHGIDVGAIRVLSGDYLDQNLIMAQHYGVISNISRNGRSAISQQAEETLQSKFKDLLDGGAQVLGGQEFLKQHKEFSPLALSTLNDNLGTTRLAGGTYAMVMKLLGKSFILLNPFHAYQLVPYTTPGHAIIIFEGLSRMSWADLRQKIAGVTDPKQAEAGSLRRQFLENKEKLGLKDVDKGTNGVHMSAGPLEGLVELQRFFSDPAQNKTLKFEETAFGALLASSLGSDAVTQLAANPDFTVNGKRVSAFDLTEESNSTDALAALKNALGK